MWKNIPNTSKEKYISGFEALNVVSEDGITIADWHPLKYWVYSKQSPEIFLYSYNPLLGMSGIKERIIDYKPNQKVFIANFPRAIADYIFVQPQEFAREMLDCRKDFLSTKKEEEELYSYLKKINKSKDISWFIKKEFPKEYLKDEKEYLKNEKTEKYPLNIENVNINDLKELSRIKVIAFSQRDKIRDFYDIAFLLDKNDKLFTDDQLYEIKTIMEYKDLKVLAMYLDKEFSKNCLKKINSKDFVLQTYLKLNKLLIARNK